ncbi:MAG: aminotransferase class IV [Nibricoccus sp.]
MNNPAVRYLPQAAFQGVVVETSAIRISALGDGFMFGHGLFETIKVAAGWPVVFEDHVARLRRSAAALGLAFDGNPERLRTLCGNVIAANNLVDGNLKLVLFQDAGGMGEIVLARSGVYPKETYARGFRLTVETVMGRPALAAHKTLNYFENIAAKRRAIETGFDEPIFVDIAGEIFEGATTNLFMVKAGRVYTPPTDGRILPGIARDRVLHSLGAKALQIAISWQQLREADEVFVTNALLGVMPVAEIDGACFDLTKNPVTHELMAALA